MKFVIEVYGCREVAVNLKNPIRNWIKRTTEVFSGERRRLQKPGGSKGVAQKKVPDKGTCLPKD